MSGEMTVRALRARLDRGETAAAQAVAALAAWAVEAPTRATRLDACQLLGDPAGRALGAESELAERAAFALLEAARLADTAADRRGVIAARVPALAGAAAEGPGRARLRRQSSCANAWCIS